MGGCLLFLQQYLGGFYRSQNIRMNAAFWDFQLERCTVTTIDLIHRDPSAVPLVSWLISVLIPCRRRGKHARPLLFRSLTITALKYGHENKRLCSFWIIFVAFQARPEPSETPRASLPVASERRIDG